MRTVSRREKVALSIKSALDTMFSEAGLNDRQRQYMELRFGLDGGPIRSRRIVGEAMGISRERADQIEQRTMRRLHGVISDNPREIQMLYVVLGQHAREVEQKAIRLPATPIEPTPTKTSRKPQPKEESAMNNRPERMLYPINEAADQLGIGRSKVYQLIVSSQLETVKIGRRTLVPAEALTQYVERLIASTRGE